MYGRAGDFFLMLYYCRSEICCFSLVFLSVSEGSFWTDLVSYLSLNLEIGKFNLRYVAVVVA